MCMLVVSNVLLQQAPELMVHKRLVYETDSQTSLCAISLGLDVWVGSEPKPEAESGRGVRSGNLATL